MSESMPRATIDQAKAAWEAHPDPSVRSVCAALKAQNLSCSVATLQRWKRSDWVLKGKTRNAEKTSQEAQAAVAAGVNRQDDKTLTRMEIISAEEAEMKQERETLLSDDVSDAELARKAMRESLVAQIVLARQVTRRAAFLAEVAPGTVPKIIEALKGPAASTTIVLPPAADQAANGDGARVVEGRLLKEPSATQVALEAFQARRRAEVAA